MCSIKAEALRKLNFSYGEKKSDHDTEIFIHAFNGNFVRVSFLLSELSWQKVRVNALLFW